MKGAGAMLFRLVSRWLSIFVVIFLIFNLVACGGGGGGAGADGGGGDTPSDKGAVVNIGFDSELVTDTIGQLGGTLEGPSGSPVEGVRVDIPAGALDDDTQITIGYNDGSITPVLGEFGGLILVLKTDGNNQFNKPLEITVPIKSGNGIPIPYHVDDQERLHLMDPASFDPDLGTFSFYSWHASLFTIIYHAYDGNNNLPTLEGNSASDLKVQSEPDDSNPLDSGFRPDPNGFDHDNDGVTFYKGGECFGFTAFAQWYYMNHKDVPLLYRFSGSVSGTIQKGQIITPRAQASTQKFPLPAWTTIEALKDFFRQIPGYTLNWSYSTLCNALANTGGPILMSLITSGLSAHSVLAYNINEDGNIMVYDPNYPKDSTRVIYFNRNNENDYDPYGKYDYITVLGNGSWAEIEPFENIMDDAVANFQGSTEPTVIVTSHKDTEDCESDILAGRVESTYVLAEYLRIFVNGVEQGVLSIPISGDWIFPDFVLEDGDIVTFEIEGYHYDEGMKVYEVDPSSTFRLKCSSDITFPATYKGGGFYRHSVSYNIGEMESATCGDNSEWTVTLNADGTLLAQWVETKTTRTSGYAGTAECFTYDEPSLTHRWGKHVDGHFEWEESMYGPNRKVIGVYDSSGLKTEPEVWSNSYDLTIAVGPYVGGTESTTLTMSFSLTRPQQ
jgi:hypothetical protein